MHALHDQTELVGGGSGADDDDSASGCGCGGAERQTSQRDFWAEGLMNVQVVHAQDDIFANEGRVLGNFGEILRVCRNWGRRDFAAFGSEDIINLKLTLFCRFETQPFGS